MQGLKHMLGYEVSGHDGRVGRVEDFFVEEGAWVVRYVSVRTGSVLSGERALTPVGLISGSDVSRRVLSVDYSKAELNALAPAEGVSTFSAEMESIVDTLYGGHETRRDRGLVRANNPVPQPEFSGAPLRSVKELTSYHIETLDGPCGLCTDLLADTSSWSIPYLVVNTKEWIPHGHVLVPSAWVRDISWREMQTDVAVHRPKVQHAQRFDPASHDVWHGGAKPLHRTA